MWQNSRMVEGSVTLLNFRWFALSVFCVSQALAADIPVAQYDSARTLSNPAEIYLTTSNVSSAKFGKLFARTVDGDTLAQPLYLENVAFPGKTVNVVYVVTMHNNVYAFDADNPSAFQPLWSVNLGQFDSPSGWISDLGILGTPVIVRNLQAMYLVAATIEGGQRVYRLHVLDLLSGTEKFGGPVVITAQIAGTAAEGQNGIVPFIPGQQTQRTGLATTGNSLLIGFSSDRDHEPEHGWVFTYNLATLQQTGIFNDTPNGDRGGIWQSGRAPAIDANGSAYFETGNGTFDGSTEFGESAIKLKISQAGSLSVADWFTPDIWSQMNDLDYDFGSTGPTLIPGTDLLLTGGKTGVFYLMHTSSMGHVQSGNNQIVQNFLATTGCQIPLMDQGCAQIMGQAFWYSAAVPTLYVWGVHDQLKAFQFSNGQFNISPATTGTLNAYYPGGVLAHSSYQGTAGTGIVWAVTSDVADNGFYFGPGWVGTGTLHAYDATDLTRELWNSSQNLIRDGLGNFASFAPPVIANGKVYMASFSNQLVVYGLLNGPVPGDVNGDSVVNCSDIAIVKASFGKTSTQVGFDLRADINPDGVVNVRDLSYISARLPSGTVCH
jgi:hypothetical protein